MTHKSTVGAASAGTGMLAFVAGVGAGLAAGLLLAPKKGEETRAQLKEKVHEAKSKAQQRMAQQKEKAQETVDDAANKTQGLLREGQAKVEETRARTQRRTVRGSDEG